MGRAAGAGSPSTFRYAAARSQQRRLGWPAHVDLFLSLEVVKLLGSEGVPLCRLANAFGGVLVGRIFADATASSPSRSPPSPPVVPVAAPPPAPNPPPLEPPRVRFPR